MAVAWRPIPSAAEAALLPQCSTFDTRRQFCAASPFDLGKLAGDVAHAPMFGELAVRDAENIAGCESHPLAGRRQAEQRALLRPFIDEARRDLVVACNHRLDR